VVALGVFPQPVKPSRAAAQGGTAKAVPFLQGLFPQAIRPFPSVNYVPDWIDETSFISRRSGTPVVNSKESHMRFADATNVNRKSGCLSFASRRSNIAIDAFDRQRRW
jgi:hypothetical protein